jgi:uncharacterized membrane protein
MLGDLLKITELKYVKILFVSVLYIGYFCIAMAKISDRTNQKEKLFMLAHSFRDVNLQSVLQ